MKKYFLAFLPLLLLAGCGDSGLNGDYVAKQPSPFDKFSFHSSGSVDITTMGITAVGKYKKDGSRVEVTLNGNTMLLMIDPAGCLAGDLDIKLCKA